MIKSILNKNEGTEYYFNYFKKQYFFRVIFLIITRGILVFVILGIYSIGTYATNVYLFNRTSCRFYSLFLFYVLSTNWYLLLGI